MIARGVTALALAFLGFVRADAARAQSNPGFFPERYVACRKDDARRAPPPAPTPQAAPPSLVPLPRVRSRATLSIAPLVLIDVAVAEPIPARPSAPLALPPPPEPSMVASAAQDWRCIGFVRGKAGILRVLHAPPLSRFAGHPDARSWQLLNARAASTARFVEAVPDLRRLLARPEPNVPDDAERPDGSRLFDGLDLKLNASRALGDLDDAPSATALRAHLAAREDRSYSIIWKDGLPALARLDRRVAEDYAIEVIERVALGRNPSDPRAAGDDTLARSVLPLLVTPDPARLATLKRWPSGQDRCDVLAARVRLGDVALRDELRADLATDLRTQRAVACYGELMPDVFPGASTDEVKTLLFRHRMEAILDLLHRSRSVAASDPAWQRARSELRAGLSARANDPDIVGGRSDSRYQPVKRARYLVALAELGDADARALAEQLIRDPSDHGIAPWIAAAQVLRFDWPNAADLAATRLGFALRDHTDRYDTDLDPVRGFTSLNDHTDVVDALAARRDPRFALGLLDREPRVREIAAFHLARLRSPATCDVVASAARDAQERAVQDAFWTLSMLGDACRVQAHRLATDVGEPAHVRGMALELLAMMRDARVKPLLASPGRRDDIRAARERARIIYFARE